MSASEAKRFGRSARGSSDIGTKLDYIARAIDALADALDDIEKRLKNTEHAAITAARK